jgi:hypothetical protein
LERRATERGRARCHGNWSRAKTCCGASMIWSRSSGERARSPSRARRSRRLRRRSARDRSSSARAASTRQ